MGDAFSRLQSALNATKGLKPEFSAKLGTLTTELDKAGIPYRIREGYRSPFQQARLYAQGRTTSGPIVTGVQGTAAKHPQGRAADIDIEPKYYKQFGAIAENVGLRWGGRWKNPYDPGHVEDPDDNQDAFTRLRQAIKTQPVEPELTKTEPAESLTAFNTLRSAITKPVLGPRGGRHVQMAEDEQGYQVPTQMATSDKAIETVRSGKQQGALSGGKVKFRDRETLRSQGILVTDTPLGEVVHRRELKANEVRRAAREGRLNALLAGGSGQGVAAGSRPSSRRLELEEMFERYKVAGQLEPAWNIAEQLRKQGYEVGESEGWPYIKPPPGPPSQLAAPPRSSPLSGLTISGFAVPGIEAIRQAEGRSAKLRAANTGVAEEFTGRYRGQQEHLANLESIVAGKSPAQRERIAEDLMRREGRQLDQQEMRILNLDPGLLSGLWNRFAGGLSETVGSTLKTAGRTLKALPLGPTYDVGGEIYEKTGRALSQEGQIQSQAKGQQGVVGDVAGALGGSLPFFVGGGLPGTAGKAITGLLGWAVQADQAYEEAIQAGKTPKEALLIGHATGPIGLTEMFGVGGTLNRVARGTLIKDFIGAIKREAGEEATQEGIQGILTDLAAKGLYDSKRELFKQVPYNVLIGAITGGVFGTAAHAPMAVAQRLTQGTQPTQKPVVVSPVPESSTTIAAQFEALTAGQRRAMLVTPGSTMPDTPKRLRRQGFLVTQTRDGQVIHQASIRSREVRQRVADGTLGELLGYVEPKPNPGEPLVIVEARTPDGQEIQTAVVSPQAVAAQATQFKAQYPEAVIQTGDEVTAERIVQQRREQVEPSVAPRAPSLQAEAGVPPLTPVQAGEVGEVGQAGEAGPPAPRRLAHEQFGEVIVSENQSGVPAGKLRVTETVGDEHIVQNPRTKGNRSATFVRPAEQVTPAIPEPTPVETIGESAERPRITGIAGEPTVPAVAAAAQPKQAEIVPTPQLAERRTTPGQPPPGMPERRGLGERARSFIARKIYPEGTVDPKTGLQNKAEFERARKRLDSDPKVEIVQGDLDYLKRVNDQFGHPEGDKYLAAVGEAVRRVGEEMNIPTRQQFLSGGDEFTVGLPKGQGEQFKNRLREEVAKITLPDGSPGSISVGIGDTHKTADDAAIADKKARRIQREVPTGLPGKETRPQAVDWARITRPQITETGRDAKLIEQSHNEIIQQTEALSGKYAGSERGSIYQPTLKGDLKSNYFAWYGGRGRPVDVDIAALNKHGRVKESEGLAKAFEGVSTEYRRAYFHAGSRKPGSQWGPAWFTGQLEGAGISERQDVADNVQAVYLAIKNPLEIDGEFHRVNPDTIAKAKKAGHDALIGYNTPNGETVYVIDPGIIHDVPPSESTQTAKTPPTTPAESKAAAEVKATQPKAPPITDARSMRQAIGHAFPDISEDELSQLEVLAGAFAKGYALETGRPEAEYYQQFEFARGGRPGKGTLESRLEQGQKQTDTPEFKRWFGESVVTDTGKPGGEPLVVYHGTTANFDVFDLTQPARSGSRSAVLGPHFTDRPGIAEWFTANKPSVVHNLLEPETKKTGSVMPVYLSIQRPFRMNAKAFKSSFESTRGRKDAQIARAIRLRQSLIDRDHDGIIVEADREQGVLFYARTFIAFSPTQIKSAIGNRGTFDPNSPNILEQGPKGFVEFIADGRVVIHALEQGDITTVIHELAHVARRYLGAEDLAIVEKWAGVKDGKWGKAAEEKFARGFERYMHEGKAPSKELQSVFDKIKEWFRAVYQHIVGSEIDLSISPEVRRIFGRMLGVAEPTSEAEVQLPAPKATNLPAIAERAQDWESVNPEDHWNFKRSSLLVQTDPVFRQVIQKAAAEMGAGPQTTAEHKRRVTREEVRQRAAEIHPDLAAEAASSFRPGDPIPDKAIFLRAAEYAQDLTRRVAEIQEQMISGKKPDGSELTVDDMWELDHQQDEMFRKAVDISAGLTGARSEGGRFLSHLAITKRDQLEAGALVARARNQAYRHGMEPDSLEWKKQYEEKIIKLSRELLDLSAREKQLREQMERDRSRKIKFGKPTTKAPTIDDKVQERLGTLEAAALERLKPYNKGPNVLFQSDIPSEVADLAIVFAARVASAKGKPLAQIRSELSAQFGDVFDQNQEGVENRADEILYDQRRQARLEALRSPNAQTVQSARNELAAEVKERQRRAKETRTRVERANRQEQAEEAKARSFVGDIESRLRREAEAEDANRKLQQARADAAEAQKRANKVAAEDRQRRRKAQKAANRWDFSMKQGAAVANAKAQAGDPLTVDDLTAIGLAKSYDTGMNDLRFEQEMRQLPTFDKHREAVMKRIAQERRRLALVRKEQRVLKGQRAALTDQQAAQTVADYDAVLKAKQQAQRKLAKVFAEIETPSAYERVIEIISIPKSAITAGELSATLRQAGFLITEPRAMLHAFGKQVESFVSEKRYLRGVNDLVHHSRFNLMRKSGMYLTTEAKLFDPRAAAREERYPSKLVENFPILKQSQRAFDMFIDTLRADVFDKVATQWEKAGITWESNPEDYIQLARVLNTLTGRGDLGKYLNRAAPLLNALAFSGRLAKSRIDLMNPVYYLDVRRKSPRAGRFLARKALGFYTTAMSVTGLMIALGATTSLDPDDDEFLKFRFGNIRFDIFSSTLPYIRVFARIIKRGVLKAKGIKATDSQQLGEILLRMLRGKASPILGAAWTLVTGEDYKGEEKGLRGALAELIAPLYYKDIYEGIKVEGLKGGLKVAFPGFLGVGTSSYKEIRVEAIPRGEIAVGRGTIERGEGQALKLARAFAPEPGIDEPMTEDSKHQREVRIALINAIKSQDKAEEKRLTDIAIKEDLFSERQWGEIGKHGGMPSLLYYTSRLGIKNALEVYKAATESQRTELWPLIEKKIGKNFKNLTRKDKQQVDKLLEDVGKPKASPTASRHTVPLGSEIVTAMSRRPYAAT